MIKEIEKNLSKKRKIIHWLVVSFLNILIFMLVIQIITNQTISNLESNKEKIAKNITTILLNQQKSELFKEINEKENILIKSKNINKTFEDITNGKSLEIKNKIHNQVKNILNSFFDNIKEYNKKINSKVNPKKTSVFILILITILFINSGFLVTLYFLSKNLIRIGFYLLLPYISLYIINNKQILSKIINFAKIKLEITNKTNEELVIKILNNLLNPIKKLFSKYLIIGILLIFLGFVLSIIVKKLAKNKNKNPLKNQ